MILLPDAPLRETDAAVLADKVIKYANKEGLWPTLDFIVKRWTEKNKDSTNEIKSGVHDAQLNLRDDFGSNINDKNGAMNIRRIVEIPASIHMLMDILFRIEIEHYKGGKKKFYQDFSKRYPIFKVAKKI